MGLLLVCSATHTQWLRSFANAFGSKILLFLGTMSLCVTMGLAAATLLGPIGEGAGERSGEVAGDSYLAILSWMELDLTAWAPCVDALDSDLRLSTGFLKLTGGGRVRVWLVLGPLIRGPRRLELVEGCTSDEGGLITGKGLGTRWGDAGDDRGAEGGRASGEDTGVERGVERGAGGGGGG